jgi:hypothetical protein
LPAPAPGSKLPSKSAYGAPLTAQKSPPNTHYSWRTPAAAPPPEQPDSAPSRRRLERLSPGLRPLGPRQNRAARRVLQTDPRLARLLPNAPRASDGPRRPPDRWPLIFGRWRPRRSWFSSPGSGSGSGPSARSGQPRDPGSCGGRRCPLVGRQPPLLTRPTAPFPAPAPRGTFVSEKFITPRRPAEEVQVPMEPMKARVRQMEEKLATLQDGATKQA